MALGLLWLFQSLHVATHGEVVDKISGDFPTQRLNALNYPHVKVGPYNWKYFRGWFATPCM